MIYINERVSGFIGVIKNNVIPNDADRLRDNFPWYLHELIWFKDTTTTENINHLLLVGIGVVYGVVNRIQLLSILLSFGRLNDNFIV